MAFARWSPDRGGSARSTTSGSSGTITCPTVLNGSSRNLRLVTASHMGAHPVVDNEATTAAIVSARHTFHPARNGQAILVTEWPADTAARRANQPEPPAGCFASS